VQVRPTYTPDKNTFLVRGIFVLLVVSRGWAVAEPKVLSVGPCPSAVTFVGIHNLRRASTVQFKPLDTQGRLIISNKQPIYIYLTTRRGATAGASRVRLVQDSRPTCGNLTARRDNRRFHRE
jgi:hypothetical protein